MIKAIVFDVDWVIVISAQEKRKILDSVFEDFWLNWIPEIEKIKNSWLNRKVILDLVNEITPIDKDKILLEINNRFMKMELNPTPNQPVIHFIKNFADKYLFFTNTALSIEVWWRVLNALQINHLFGENYSFDTGTKKENIENIMKKYWLKWEEILFIEDNINHINAVKETGVHILYFTDYEIDIEKYINTNF